MLEFNMANVLDGLVGSSEQNIRKVLAVAESMAPCVLMVDEIDKALTGLGSSGGDSGVTRRVVGSFLTWLNDRKSQVYVIATANDLREISIAMPELLLKEDGMIFMGGFGGQKTRRKIIEIHLRKIPPVESRGCMELHRRFQRTVELQAEIAAAVKRQIVFLPRSKTLDRNN